MKIYSIIPYNVKNQYNKGNFKQQTYNTAPPPEFGTNTINITISCIHRGLQYGFGADNQAA